MIKSIIREITIILIICLSIILVLGILLYNYVPNNKMIPNKVSYQTPIDIQEELRKSDNVDNEEIILTYSINSTDLNNYEKIHTYVPGKPNPFSEYEEKENTTQNENSTQNGNTNKNINQGDTDMIEDEQNTNNIENSEDLEYFPDTGTK